MLDRHANPSLYRAVLESQKNEITEYYIYTKLSRAVKDSRNSVILEKIGREELGHYTFWKEHTGVEVKPSQWKIFFYYWVARVFGLTFGIKLMEHGEESAQDSYMEIAKEIPGAERIAHDEESHEHQLIEMIEEERLEYVGSVVLGLNDALVELTGTLAGLTFALQKTSLIALAGLITGIAASLSMAASEYLSSKSDGENERALKSSIYTGIAYITTVILLILPYLLLDNYMLCLGLTLLIALSIIFFFNYYISVAKDLNFWSRFGEMALISMGVALISFGIGVAIRQTIGVDI